MTTILHGDALTQLDTLPSNSVDCCITSPPYWALRDYGIDGQIGLEKTPEAWCEKLVNVFRNVRRVLKPTGTCWVNVGDCYSTGQGSCKIAGGGQRGERWRVKGTETPLNRMPIEGIKPKDLVGQPWMLAFALRADGWFLRRDIIWHKPNTMPESTKDRPTTAHEYLFLLSKSQQYYFDHVAIMEPVTGSSHARGRGVNQKAKTPAGWMEGEGSHERIHKEGRNSRIHVNRDARHPKPRQNASFSVAVRGLVSMRACRSVWSIPTAPFRGGHFATFPPRLAERCILAETSAHGCCSICGAPWVRVLGEPQPIEGRGSGNKTRKFRGEHGGNSVDASRGHSGFAVPWSPSAPQTLNWQPTCKCTLAGIEPAVVLDPFAGAGTTLLIAQRLGRSGIGIELNPKYVQMAQDRLSADRAKEASA